ncbi:barstar family protein [Streptomyces sp. TX20-6-3]|uniref:barstar family protein n=1 Tax=Streptomyces sp. TX20-6-3 TaxID=3028705 RepID=UPI0029AF4D89|nr:barstar family protein [Streptomyces sp. TX20-6-3]MDX2564890.1 barstar family protein [Streptomyces sp. TX20-6-3]
MRIDDPLVLDLTGVTDKAGLMDRCATVLALPDWFGRNWDALADCLTDLPEPVTLVVTGWREYARTRPREWRTAQDVFATAVDRRPTHLTVLVALGEAFGGSDEASAASLG